MDPNFFQPQATAKNSTHSSHSPVRNLTPVSFYLGLVIFMVGTVAQCVHFGLFDGLFLSLIAFGPLMLACIPMRLCRTQRSQRVLVFADVAFLCWFLVCYLPLNYPHNVPELDGLLMVAVGVCALPVLLVLCIIAIWLHQRDSRATQLKPQLDNDRPASPSKEIDT